MRYQSSLCTLKQEHAAETERANRRLEVVGRFRIQPQVSAGSPLVAQRARVCACFPHLPQIQLTNGCEGWGRGSQSGLGQAAASRVGAGRGVKARGSQQG